MIKIIRVTAFFNYRYQFTCWNLRDLANSSVFLNNIHSCLKMLPCRQKRVARIVECNHIVVYVKKEMNILLRVNNLYFAAHLSNHYGTISVKEPDIT